MVFTRRGWGCPTVDVGAFLANPVSRIILGATLIAAVVVASVVLLKKNRGR